MHKCACIYLGINGDLNIVVGDSLRVHGIANLAFACLASLRKNSLANRLAVAERSWR